MPLAVCVFVYMFLTACLLAWLIDLNPPIHHMFSHPTSHKRMATRLWSVTKYCLCGATILWRMYDDSEHVSDWLVDRGESLTWRGTSVVRSEIPGGFPAMWSTCLCLCFVCESFSQPQPSQHHRLLSVLRVQPWFRTIQWISLHRHETRLIQFDLWLFNFNLRRVKKE